MPKKRMVEMINKAGKVVKTYTSLSEAGRDNFMSTQNIRYRCVGHIKHPFKTYPYTFRYKE